MNSEISSSQGLCMYQDEAVGANPIPLSILGNGLHIKKSSDYFMKDGIIIDLKLGEMNEILKIQLGSDICVDIATMRTGIEVGPYGLFPVHTLQVTQGFCTKTGGVVRFGFLKRIFTAKSLAFAALRFLSKVFGLQFHRSFESEQDISTACTDHYGSENWGMFDIVVKKNAAGDWTLVQKSTEKNEQPIKTIVAHFNVNRAGIALGINGMYCK